MEAATPLRPPSVRILGGRLVIDGLVVADDCAVRLVAERVEAGDDPAKVVTDAIGIGARVLEREQAGAGVDVVRAELEKVARETEAAFADKARTVAEFFDQRVNEVFGPENGHLVKALERHFSDGSSSAVQHRVKELVAEVMTKSREDLVRQFSASDGQNPLADFKHATLSIVRDAGDRQDASLRALLEKMAALERELQGLRDERDKQLELAAERERGTAKGRDFEAAVADALDEIARGQGDDCDSVGDLKGATGKTGDVVVAIDGCRGPARGRVVFEAKNSRISKPEALRQLDQALAERDADFAVLVVPGEDKVPARMVPLLEYNGDKLIVTYDPEEGSKLTLEVAYALARARVLMSRAGEEGVDAAAVRETVERALASLDEVRKVKSQLTGATTSIETARELVDRMADVVRSHLRNIEALIAGAGPPSGG